MIMNLLPNRSPNTVAPRFLVGLNDVRHKIGTDVDFYVKGAKVFRRKFAKSLNYNLNVIMSFAVNEDAVPCQASWLHNDSPVVSSPRLLIRDGQYEFSLNLRALEITDDGVWAVEVRNDLGKVREQCKLTLKGKENQGKENLSNNQLAPLV